MLLYWLAIGLIAGFIAKSITPQAEKGGWLSTLVIGLAGSVLGGLVFGILGLQSSTFIGSLITAVIGALVVLYLYYKYYVARNRD